MEKAIKVLQEKIISCEAMKVWYEKELEKYQHTTADQMEIKRLKIIQQENIDIHNECLSAVELIKINKI